MNSIRSWLMSRPAVWRLIVDFISRFNVILSWVCFYPYALRRHFTPLKHVRRLHVGCGRNYIPGWINADIHPAADMVVFLGRRLPFSDSSISHIYCEHVIEHVPRDVAIFFLKECKRVLAPGGVVRVATPDLKVLVEDYLHGWQRQDWVNWPEFRCIDSPARMLNMAFRGWGHCFIYDSTELIRLFNEVGFLQARLEPWGISQDEALLGLETRIDSTLIVEGRNIISEYAAR